ncbi:hypothetical protein UlMin_020155 [Ulmus minor]
MSDFAEGLKLRKTNFRRILYLRHRRSIRNVPKDTIATVCIFLACKLEETPRFLNDFVVVAYEMMNKWDRLLLSTITFDLDIQLPYKPLVVALKKLNIFRDHLARVAWNFVNDWLCTTLCLQYRPHYIVDGSMFVAAKLQKVKLPTEKGRVWWLGKYAYLYHQFINPCKSVDYSTIIENWKNKEQKCCPNTNPAGK